jgi:hypothetical protein
MPDGNNGSFRTAFAQLAANTGGINAVVVGPAAARDLQRQAAAGDRQAKILLRSLVTALIEPDWHTGEWWCGLCEHRFRELPTSFLLLVPRHRDSGVFLVVGFCHTCNTEKPIDGQRDEQIVARRFCVLQLSTKEYRNVYSCRYRR